jgi:hypothetical protein
VFIICDYTLTSYTSLHPKKDALLVLSYGILSLTELIKKVHNIYNINIYMYYKIYFIINLVIFFINLIKL